MVQTYPRYHILRDRAARHASTIGPSTLSGEADKCSPYLSWTARPHCPRPQTLLHAGARKPRVRFATAETVRCCHISLVPCRLCMFAFATGGRSCSHLRRERGRARRQQCLRSTVCQDVPAYQQVGTAAFALREARRWTMPTESRRHFCIMTP